MVAKNDIKYHTSNIEHSILHHPSAIIHLNGKTGWMRFGTSVVFSLKLPCKGAHGRDMVNGPVMK